MRINLKAYISQAYLCRAMKNKAIFPEITPEIRVFLKRQPLQ